MLRQTLTAAACTLSLAPLTAQELREHAQILFERIPEDAVALDTGTPTEEQVEPGKMLFFEPRLSRGHNLSCNTGHNLGTGGADLSPVSLGRRWQQGDRSSPTVLNAVVNIQFWDGRAADLVEQAGAPLVSLIETGSSEEHVMATLTGIPGYDEHFSADFPEAGAPQSFEYATQAIAASGATLVTPDSPLDGWLAGDEAALTDERAEGLQIFIDAGCASCHSGMNLGGSS